jgi:hypothetical protein
MAMAGFALAKPSHRNNVLAVKAARSLLHWCLPLIKTAPEPRHTGWTVKINILFHLNPDPAFP